MLKNELYHHGILGQKWGKRNGPPYPLRPSAHSASEKKAGWKKSVEGIEHIKDEYEIIPKGKKLNSVSTVENSENYKNNRNGRWMYTYDSNDEWDNKVYKGPFSEYLVRNRDGYVRYDFGKFYLDGSKVTEHFFETKKDIKVPTRNTRINLFKDLYNEDKKKVSEELKDAYVRARAMSNIFDLGKNKPDFSNLVTDDDFEKAYKIFNVMMENASYYSITKKYSKEISKRYHGMVDDNNKDLYNEAHNPLIIFDPEKTLEIVNKARNVPLSEINKNYKEVGDKMRSKGKSVLL